MMIFYQEHHRFNLSLIGEVSSYNNSDLQDLSDLFLIRYLHHPTPYAVTLLECGGILPLGQKQVGLLNVYIFSFGHLLRIFRLS